MHILSQINGNHKLLISVIKHFLELCGFKYLKIDRKHTNKKVLKINLNQIRIDYTLQDMFVSNGIWNILSINN